VGQPTGQSASVRTDARLRTASPHDVQPPQPLAYTTLPGQLDGQDGRFRRLTAQIGGSRQSSCPPVFRVGAQQDVATLLPVVQRSSTTISRA
jgi:hypothetical protein